MKRRLPLYLLCLVFLGIAIYSGYQIISILMEYNSGEQTYDSLEQYVSTPITKDSESNYMPNNADIQTDENNLPQVDFAALKEINEYIVAWIYIEGTEINYPVVRGKDNDYYLYRMFDGRHNKAGSIFMDYRNSMDFSDKNTVIYGHQMKNGSMFHALLGYKKQDFFDTHPICLIMTPEKNYKMELFAGYVASLDGPSWDMDFASDDAFAQWLDFAMRRSTFVSDIVPTVDDRVVTLSTCSSEFQDARYVVVGILNEQA